MGEEILSKKIERKLYIKPYDRMVKDLVDEINDKQIILDPDYQRNYVWGNDKASLLVESILLNIPIPVIYASEDFDGKWIIVDGLQRLYSLKRYCDDEFKLSGLETLEELNGKKFSQLDYIVKTKLLRGELRIIVLQNDSDPNIQFDIFMRLNTGAVKLNEQELRNCLYRGKFNECIKSIVATNDDVKNIFNQSSSNRMLTNELIVRYLAVSEQYDRQLFKIINYDGRIKNLINNFMKKYQNSNDEVLAELKNKFESQIKKANSIFGKNAFRKERKSTKINASLFECIMLAFEEYTNEELVEKKDEILEGTTKLLENVEFEKSIDKATGNTEVLNYRNKKFIQFLRDIMNDAS